MVYIALLFKTIVFKNGRVFWLPRCDSPTALGSKLFPWAVGLSYYGSRRWIISHRVAASEIITAAALLFPPNCFVFGFIQYLCGKIECQCRTICHNGNRHAQHGTITMVRIISSRFAPKTMICILAMWLMVGWNCRKSGNGRINVLKSRSTVSVDDFCHMRVLVALSRQGFQPCILEPKLWDLWVCSSFWLI